MKKQELTNSQTVSQLETNYFLGFDQAIVNSGFAAIRENGNKLEYNYSELFSSSLTWKRQSDAFILLEQAAFLNKTLKEFSKKSLKCIAMEGISFGSPGGKESRGSVWGLYVTTCLRYADVVIVPPRSLKLFVTGKGTVEKKDIMNVMVPKYGLDKLGRKVYDDECDALGLCEIAYWSWRAMNEGADKIKPYLKPYEFQVIADPKKGLVNRLNEFYLRKI